MTCYTHQGRSAVGVCTACGKAVCRECVGADAPRLVCASCVGRAATPMAWSPRSYGIGWEYRSAISIGSWPLVHISFGNDPVTFRPRIAKGVIAIGNAAVGALAVGGAAFGVITIGGFSLGLAAALGGFALGAGLSIGGLAVGTVAIGGAAVGFMYAIGGGAVAPAVLSGNRCDEAALEFLRRWIAAPRGCG
jgi:hypothetical protein